MPDKGTAVSRLAIGLLACVGAACGKSDGGDGARPAAATDVPTPAELEPLERALLAVAGCEPSYDRNEEFIDRGCEPRRALREAVKQAKDHDDGPIVRLAAKHLAHEDPAVRIGSSWLLDEPMSVREGGLEPLLSAARRERDPRVATAFVWALGPVAKRQEAARAWIIEMAGHEDPKVREEVAVALSGPGARRIDGAFETLLALARDDADPEVRASACRYVAEHDNPAAVPVMTELLGSADEGSALFEGCLIGLMSLWAAGPGAARFEAAYKASVDQLRRSQSWHASMLVPSMLVSLDPAEFVEYHWFEPAPVIELIAALLRDRSVASTTREKAVEALVALDAPRPLLVELRDAYSDPEGSGDDEVRKALEKALGP